jgi:hypothetical protein
MPDINIILKATDQASGKIKDVDRALEGLDGSAKKANTGFDSLKSMMNVGLVAAATAATAAIAAVGIAIGKSVMAAADMEQGLADIRASMGLTADETAKLQAHITELGLDPKLKVSATEAADAIMTLGTAGLSTSEIMGGASKATILLANATGADFATAATVATDIMGQFNIKAEDLDEIVNQVTGATVASKFSINDMALAYSQAGGVAGAVGVSFEDFNAVLAASSSSFSSGSDAGTSFKTFLSTLLPKSAEAADVMRDLGLYTGLTGAEFDAAQGKINKVQERIAELDPTSKNFSTRLQELQKDQRELTAGMVAGGSAFFDAAGNMRDMDEVAGALQRAFGDLTEEQRLDAAETIFGSDAKRTAFALIKGGTPLITKMKEEIGKTDAEESAATRMDTFSGALEIAKGVIETLSIGIGNQFLPVLRPMIEAFTVLAQTQGPKLVEFFGDLATQMAAALTEGSKWANEVLPPLWERMVNIGAAVKEVAFMIQQWLKPVTDAIDETIGWKTVLLAIGVVLSSTVVAAIGGFMIAMAPVLVLIAKVTLVITTLKEAWKENFLNIRSITENTLDDISDWMKVHTGYWKGDWGKTLDYILKNTKQVWIDVSTFVTHQISLFTQEAFHIISVWKQDLTNKFEAWYSKTSLGIESFVTQAVWAYERLRDDAIEIWEAMLAWWETNISPWVQFGKDLIQGLWDGVQYQWGRFTDWFTRSWDGLVHNFQQFFGIHSPSRVFWGFGQDIMAGLQGGVHAGAAGLVSEMDWVAAQIKATAERATAEMLAATTYLTAQAELKIAATHAKIRNASVDIGTLVQQLGLDPTKYTAAWGGTMPEGGAGNKLPGSGSNKPAAPIYAEASKMLSAVESWINTTLKINDPLNDYLDTIKQMVVRAPIGVQMKIDEWLKFWKSEGDPLNDSVDDLRTMLKGMVTEVAAAIPPDQTIKDALGGISGSTAATSIELLGGLTLTTVDLAAAKASADEAKLTNKKTLDEFLGGISSFLEETLAGAKGVFSWFNMEESKAKAAGTLQQFVNSEVYQTKAQLKSMYGGLQQSVADILGISASELNVTGADSLRLMDRIKQIAAGTTGDTDMDFIQQLLQGSVNFRTLSNYATPGDYFGSVLPTNTGLTGGNTTTNEFNITMQGGDSSTTDVVGLVGLLNSLYGTAA